jgi:Domain of unknown function (DUF4349)
MTMLDDETITALLHELGDSYPVPPTGMADTLRRIRRGDEEGADGEQADGEGADDGWAGAGPAGDEWDQRPAPRTIRGVLRSHRWLAVAAALILLVVLAGGAALLGDASSPTRHSLASGPPQRAASPSTSRHGLSQRLSTTTTIPQEKSAAPGSSFSAQAHSAAAPATSGKATVSGAAPTGTSSLPAGAIGQPARIAQTGSLDLTVAHGALTSTMNKLTALASAYGGFVANSQTHSSIDGGASDGPPTGSVTLQVPVANFAALLAETKSLGKPSSVSTKATDVTGQYVDLQARIAALEASRQQYLTIMAKASSVGDVLAVQAQLDSLQSQIEQLQGQLAVLQSETDYSTLIVAVSEAGTHHHRTPTPAASGITKAWHDSLHGFAVGVDGVIRLAGPLLFALLCVAALVLGGRLSWRRLQRHNL